MNLFSLGQSQKPFFSARIENFKNKITFHENVRQVLPPVTVPLFKLYFLSNLQPSRAF
jgi:hypothetical protein